MIHQGAFTVLALPHAVCPPPEEARRTAPLYLREVASHVSRATEPSHVDPQGRLEGAPPRRKVVVEDKGPPVPPADHLLSALARRLEVAS